MNIYREIINFNLDNLVLETKQNRNGAFSLHVLIRFGQKINIYVI